jgi:hypothetical protein
VPYNANIPQPTDRISDSQADILGNFIALNTVMGENHYTFGTANEGKHQYVSLPEQGAAPATAVNEAALYTKIGTYDATNSQLFFRRENNGAEIECTASSLATNGWSYLPSGVLLKWGEGTTPAGGNWVLTFAVAATIPVFADVYQVMITTSSNTPGDTNNFVRLRTFTTTNITVYGSPRITVGNAAVGFRYLAIGS